MIEKPNVRDYLLACRDLNTFCTQNGWIDDGTIQFEIQSQDQHQVTVSVKFVEIIMEGAGCVADRISCFGKLQLDLDSEGNIVSSRPV